MYGMVRASLLVLVAAGFSAAAVAETVGTAGAVSPTAKARGAGAARVLNVGSSVLYGETLTTGPNGALQVLFVDRTTMTIGPNSQVVIDEFVFDRVSNSGRMAATLTRGALRFVGGQTSHTGGATLRTPVTTLGVRGGVASVRHDGASGTRVVNHFGRISVAGPEGETMLRRSGFAMGVGGTAAGSGPARSTRAEVDSFADALAPPRVAAKMSAQRSATRAAAQAAAAQADAAGVTSIQSANASSAAARHSVAGMPGQASPSRQAGDAGSRAGAARQAALLPSIAPPEA
ncbi:MAG TPA: FecR domain-containing protein, partial [Beijerinckiaceae bacterium]|nr:FecR domain-containing protein [Beijerinckiaceae bacterium]